MITKIYDYKIRTRDEKSKLAEYLTPSGNRIPSVSAILEKTKSEEAKQALFEWKKRVGEEEAQRISTESAARGTKMHSYLEHYIFADRLLNPGNDSNQIHSNKMAKVIIDNAFPNITEIWGSEVDLYYPKLYNGMTDIVGKWKGKPAIIDFKQSNKTKRKDWISDYFCQTASYAAAHNEVYKSNIQTGVVLICTQDLEYQEFVIEGDEFNHWYNEWWNKVELYYS